MGVNISNVATASSLQSLLGSPATAAPTSTGSPTQLAAAQVSPAVQAQSLLAGSESVLLGSITGGSSGLPDLSGLAETAQAYSLYTNPALLQQLAAGGASGAASASQTSGSGAVYSPPAYSFNPFDEASWWTSPSQPLGTNVDASA